MTIYTIDDDADFNMLLKVSLGRYGFDTKTHQDPKSFTDSVREKQPDLCILDLNLATGGEGFQLLKAMRNIIGDDLPIFIMSKRGDREDVLKAMKFGATDFIPKPLDDHYLLLKMKEYFPHCVNLKPIMENSSHITGTDCNATVCFDFSIKTVGLDHLEIEGDVFFSKDINASFYGEEFQEIYGVANLQFKITDCWQITPEKFGARLEKDLSIEEYFSVRRWLFQHHRAGH